MQFPAKFLNLIHAAQKVHIILTVYNLLLLVTKLPLLHVQHNHEIQKEKQLMQNSSENGALYPENTKQQKPQFMNLKIKFQIPKCNQ